MQKDIGFLLCTDPDPIRGINESYGCGFKIATGLQPDKHTCDIQLFESFDNYWKRLSKNSSVLSAAGKSIIHMEYLGHPKETIRISGAGVLSLSPICKGMSGAAHFKSNQDLLTTTIYQNYTFESLNVTKDILEILNGTKISGIPALLFNRSKTLEKATKQNLETTGAADLDFIIKRASHFAQHRDLTDIFLAEDSPYYLFTPMD